MRVGVGVCGDSPFEFSCFDWQFEDKTFVILSLIGLAVLGRPVLVFCRKYCIAKDVRGEVR